MNRSIKSQKVKIIGFLAVLLLGIFTLKSGIFTGDQVKAENGSVLKIDKSQITETVKFFPYTLNGVKMEIMAVKASDGTVRTAFNTCQVCYNSGRGYYTQEGNEVVCNNCGNRFKIDKIEKIKFGCNPIPILNDNKTDNGNTLTISKDFLAKNARFFKNWKK